MKNSDTFVVILILFFFLFPNNVFFYFGSLVFLLYILKNTRNRNKYLKANVELFVFWIFTSFIANAFFMGDVLMKESFRVVCLVLGLMLFPYSSLKCNPITIAYSMAFVLLFVFLTQIAFLYNLSMVVNFVDRYYPYEGDMIGLSSDYLLNKSSGSITEITTRISGIYRNPNQCSKFVLLGLSAFLVVNRNVILSILMLLLVALSIMLTGSRTATFIYFLIVGFWFLKTSMFSKKVKRVLILLIIPLLLYEISTLIEFDSLRILSLSDEADGDGSLTIKYKWLLTYLMNENNFVYYIVGHGAVHSLSRYGIPLLDSEVGMIIFSYGFIGFFLYIGIIAKIIQMNHRRNLDILSLLLLWCVTSTIFCSFRMCSLFLFVSSILYTYIGKENCHTDIRT